MNEPRTDQPVLDHIQELVADERWLYGRRGAGRAFRRRAARLNTIEVELDQCWDLLRQRRGLCDAGQDPSEAHVRPSEVVEDYEQ
ncbi:MAG: hypothetical protein A4E19_09375 [Nitrospira sp. SG-bin1]|nr:MAG: hypothetical protein A4E19_09375 [Nitrospira sp. SG-bin1]